MKSAAALAILTMSCPDAGAATWNVHEDGSGDAPTIQAALDLAASGDSILIHPGHYYERPVAQKNLTVIGVGGPEATTIDGDGVESAFYITDFAESFVLQGLRIVGSGTDLNFAWPYPALSQFSWSCEIRNCHLESFDVFNATMTDCRVIGHAWRGSHGNDARGPTIIERCVFEDLRDWDGASGVTIGDSGTVRDCVFSRCESVGQDPIVPVIGYAQGASPIIEDNLFVDCEGPCVGPAEYPPLAPRAEPSGRTIGFVTIRRNTFVGNQPGPLGPWEFGPVNPFFPGTFEANIVTGSEFGVWIPDGVSYEVSCTNSFGNGSNWTGFPDPSGTDGNFSAPPLFCDSDQGNYALSSGSPCAPGNHPDDADCGLIGALPVGCGTVSITPQSWGRIKGGFR